MKIGELPIGAELSMGYNEVEQELIWVKVSDQNDFVAKTRVGRKAFDAAEYQNTSRQRRTSGNAFVPHSNIFQWLNTAGDNWYQAQHEYDSTPSYYRQCGFLSNFNKAERDAMIPREITVAVPLGSRKEFGKTYSLTCKVCLPAASEIAGQEDEALGVEGAKIPGLETILADYTMTRTGVGDGAHIAAWLDYMGSFEKVRARESVPIHPMIRLNGEVDVENNGGVNTIEDKDFDARFMEIISI